MISVAPTTGTVLVIEDEPLVRIWLADVIEAAGYEVMTAATGDEGLELLKKERHLTALVTDVDIPGSLNGFALAWKMKSCHPEARVLVVSGQVRPNPNDLPPDAQFFAKPVQRQTLLRALRE
jgi:DNA-binding NtrC family response regulator